MIRVVKYPPTRNTTYQFIGGTDITVNKQL